MTMTEAKAAAATRYRMIKTAPNGWIVTDHESHAPAVYHCTAEGDYRKTQARLREYRAAEVDRLMGVE